MEELTLKRTNFNSTFARVFYSVLTLDGVVTFTIDHSMFVS